jgi:hypothetical protein
MRLAECFVAVTDTYVAEQPSFERFMETTLLMHDAVSRLLVRGLPSRPRIGARRGLITVGSPLSLTARCPPLQSDRAEGIERGVARRLIRDTCEEIRLRFEAMIQTSTPPSSSPPLPNRCPSW